MVACKLTTHAVAICSLRPRSGKRLVACMASRVFVAPLVVGLLLFAFGMLIPARGAERHVILVDTSGSMAGEVPGENFSYIGRAEAMLQELLEKPPADWTLHLAAFDSREHPSVEVDPQKPATLEVARAWTRKLAPWVGDGRTTHLWTTVDKVLEKLIAYARAHPGEPCVLHVLTDGLDTEKVLTLDGLLGRLPEVTSRALVSDYPFNDQQKLPGSMRLTVQVPAVPPVTAIIPPTAPQPSSTPGSQASARSRVAFSVGVPRPILDGEVVHFVNETTPPARAYSWKVKRMDPSRLGPVSTPAARSSPSPTPASGKANDAEATEWEFSSENLSCRFPVFKDDETVSKVTVYEVTLHALTDTGAASSSPLYLEVKKASSELLVRIEGIAKSMGSLLWLIVAEAAGVIFPALVGLWVFYMQRQIEAKKGEKASWKKWVLWGVLAVCLVSALTSIGSLFFTLSKAFGHVTELKAAVSEVVPVVGPSTSTTPMPVVGTASQNPLSPIVQVVGPSQPPALATVGELTKATADAHGLNIILDIAALLRAIVWPVVLLVIALTYRKEIPGLVKGIARRLSKLEFGGVSVELAKANAFVPDWSEAAGGLDLRRKAVALEITDSYTGTFRAQLMEEGNWEYAEINLGAGQEWLTSRLFIMAIVFARMKGIKCLVFVQTSGNVQRRFVGWAEPEKVRWALAKRFPWLEEAYSAAYSAVINFQDVAPQNLPNVPPIMQAGVIVSNEGRLGAEASAADPWPSIALIQQFVARIQSPPGQHPGDSANWVFIASAAQPCEEHARWIGSLELEDLLGTDCHKAHVDSSALRTNDTTKQLQKILAVPERFVAVTGADLRFEYLVDRRVILEQVARQLAAQTEERT